MLREEYEMERRAESYATLEATRAWGEFYGSNTFTLLVVEVNIRAVKSELSRVVTQEKDNAPAAEPVHRLHWRGLRLAKYLNVYRY